MAAETERPPVGMKDPSAIAALRARSKPLYQDLKGIPLSADFLATQIPIMVPAGVNWNSWNRSEFGLAVPSLSHGRASTLALLDLKLQEHSVIQIEFADRYGNTFREINIKGNNFWDPSGRLVQNAHSDKPKHDVNGLFDAQYVDRSVRVSKLLRKHGVDTEWIFYVAKPAEYAVRTSAEPVNIKELRQYAAKTVFSQIDSDITPEEAYKKMEFAVMLRALKTSYRLSDAHPLTGEETEVLLKRHIKMHNRDTELKKKHSDDSLPFEAIDENDIERYITEVLPQRIARNLGKVHDLGIKWRYLHPGNISLLGELVDLDSPEGALIDDTDTNATIDDCMEDINSFIGSGKGSWFRSLAKSVSAKNGLDYFWDKFRDNFTETYLSTRNIAPDSFTELSFLLVGASEKRSSRDLKGGEIKSFIDNFFRDNHDELFNKRYLKNLAEVALTVDTLQASERQYLTLQIYLARLQHMNNSTMLNQLINPLRDVLAENETWIRDKIHVEQIPNAEEINIYLMLMSVIRYRYHFELMENRLKLDDSDLPKDRKIKAISRRWLKKAHSMGSTAYPTPNKLIDAFSFAILRSLYPSLDTEQPQTM